MNDVAPNDDISHGDIYHKLGSLEGKLETVLIQLGDKREDIAAVFTRLREVETRVSIGIGVASALSLLIPLLVTATAPRIHFAPPATTGQTQPNQ